MSNPQNMVNLSISEDLYYRLNEIKSAKDWTFDKLVDTLCELEFQNNYISQIIEFEFVTPDSDNIFKITFKKNGFAIEYYTPGGYSTKIDDWSIANKDKSIFLDFIHNDCAKCILENLEVAISFQKFDIYKLV